MTRKVTPDAQDSDPISAPPLSGKPLAGTRPSAPPLSGKPLAGTRPSAPPLSGKPLAGTRSSAPLLSGKPLAGTPLPQTGGSFVRQKDGSLTRVVKAAKPTGEPNPAEPPEKDV